MGTVGAAAGAYGIDRLVAGGAVAPHRPRRTGRYRSAPDLRPPLLDVKTPAVDTAPGLLFLAPKGGPGQYGPMIANDSGQPLWFHPLSGPWSGAKTQGEHRAEVANNFRVSRYKKRPVLTWWRGDVVDGYGQGDGEMASDRYAHLETIHAGAGRREAPHELNLPPRAPALTPAYEETPAALSAAGGARRGKVLVGHAQEIDLATGKLLSAWRSLDHIGVGESYEPPPKKASTPYDYFHINSISETPDGNLLISAKNTWALYKVDRSSGAVLWRMNGKRSDFTMGPGANFYWQHDSRFAGPTRLTVFDDSSFPPEEKRSRAPLLALDEPRRRVDLTRAYVHPAGFLAANQGSVQLLADGRVFVGWGNQPYFSEFAPDGTLLLDGQFPVDVRSYRAFTHEWTGHPIEAPRAAARSNPAGGTLVYASWNGATRIDTWNVLAGPRPDALSPVGSQEWSGFETTVAVNSGAKHFQVVALDTSGRELGRSAVLERDGPPA